MSIPRLPNVAIPHDLIAKLRRLHSVKRSGTTPSPLPRTYTLTQEDLEAACQIAVARQEQATRERRQDRVATNPVETHAFGACGEIAVCRLLDTWPDKWTGGFKGKPDLILKDQRKVEIKTRHNHQYNIMMSEYEWRRMDPDQYLVLVTGVPQAKLYLRGYITVRDALPRRVEVHHPQFGTKLELRQHYLRPFNDLIHPLEYAA